MTNSNVNIPLGPAFIFSYWQCDGLHHEMVSRFVIIGSREFGLSSGQPSVSNNINEIYVIVKSSPNIPSNCILLTKQFSVFFVRLRWMFDYILKSLYK